MLLDTSVALQTYIEDCEVCCRPIEIRYEAERNRILSFSAEQIP